jgi:hypothetical protein
MGGDIMAELKLRNLSLQRFQEEVANELGIDLKNPPATPNIQQKEQRLHADRDQDNAQNTNGRKPGQPSQQQ